MATKEFPLVLIIKAVDKATAPLRAISAIVNKSAAPIKSMGVRFAGVGKAIGNVGSQVASLGVKVGAMAVGAGFALYQITQSAVNAGDDMATFAERVGLGVDAYAQLQFAAAQADVDQQSFNTAMDQFTKRLGEAKAGSGSMLAFLKSVSPALAKQVQGAKSTEEAFALMTGAFEKVTDPAKRAALANAAFGRSGMQMGVFLGRGSEEIDKLREEFYRLSGSQVAFAAGAGALDEAMRETQTAFTGVRNAVMAELFPAFTELSKAVTGFLVENREGIAKWAKETAAALNAWIASGGIDRLATGLREFAGATKIVVEKLGGLQGIATIVAAVMGSKVVWAIGGVVGSLAKLLPSMNAVIGAVQNLGIWLYLYAWPALVKVGEAFLAAAPLAGAFAAAALGVAAAGAQVYRYWDRIGELFSDFTKPGGLLSTMRELGEAAGGTAFFQMLDPRTALRDFGILGPKTQPVSTGAAAAVAAAPPAAGASGSAHVTVDFNNLPPGARVSTSPQNTADLDMSMGYSMVSG